MSAPAKVIPFPSYARKEMGRWALGGYPSAVIAEHLGIRSAARARRVRAEALDPISVACNLAADSRGDGSRIVTVVQQAYESRWIEEAAADARRLRQRIGHLRDVAIHNDYARVMRAFCADASSLNDAASSLCSGLVELCAIRRALKLEI